MKKAETKRPIGISESVYLQIEQYAQDNTLFLFEVVEKMWEEFLHKHTSPVKKPKAKKR